MTEDERFFQYKEHLLTMINSINSTIPLKEENQVLIVYKLNTVEKIRNFFEWIRHNLQEGNLKATEAEIVRAAVKIGNESKD